MFLEVKPIKKEVLVSIKGIHPDSRLFVSPRSTTLPYVEIRAAKQEDNDDLAEVADKQSAMQTGVFGKFFIAEVISGQSDTKKALVAQVKNKAVGIMVVSKDVDINMLHKCFKLDSYDNLLKPEFMDAVRKRRDVIRQEKLKEEEEARKTDLKKLKEETIVKQHYLPIIEMQYNCAKSGAARIL